jgi:phosphatidylinositol-3-phosphatase
MKHIKSLLLIVCFASIFLSYKKNVAEQPVTLPPTSFSPEIPLRASGVPKPDHVVLLIMENHAYQQIIGSSSAPYITALAKAAHSTSFTQSYAVEHPSQPNYLDIYSGENQGVTDDNLPTGIPFTTANLGRQLIDSAKTYTTYSEGLPSVGYNGTTSGEYARKHNPAANWMGTGTNQIPTTTNQPFTAYPTDFTKLPTVSIVIPNLDDDMHDGTIAEGDTWVKNNMDPYIQWAKTHNSVFIITFDEDDDNHGNQIPTIFSGQHVKTLQDTMTINHYNVLRTMEAMYKLKYVANASKVKTITNCWK